MSVTVDDIETSTKTAIGNLLLQADEPGKRVLTAYVPTASKTANIASIKAFNLDVIEPFAEFMGIELANEQQNKIYTKATLAVRIYQAIEAMLPSTCSDCGQIYMNELQPADAPLFHCFICYQGAHHCVTIKSRHTALMESAVPIVAGSVWLCHTCLGDHNPAKPRASKIRHDSNASQTHTRHASNASHPGNEAENRDTVLQNQQNTQPQEQEVVNEQQHVPPKQICPRYKTGKCPHGLRGNKVVEGNTCPFDHPKRCIKFCGFGPKHKYGCKKSTNCRYFHPALCKFSVQKKLCTNESCTFVHLKGTKRKAGPPDGQPSSNSERPAEPPYVHQGSQRAWHPSQSAPPRPPVSDNNPNNILTAQQDLLDHFLELKTLVQSMGSNFQREIAMLKAGLPQQRTVHYSTVFPPHTPSPPNMHLQQQHLQQQAQQMLQQQFNPEAAPFHPPPMQTTYIPPTSC